jgi:cytosine/adenosine deaminase-related metal-dependent hydrolase
MSNLWMRLRRILRAAALGGLFFQVTCAQVSLVVENAILVTMEETNREPFLGWFSVNESGRIVELAPGRPPGSLQARSRLDATGKIVIPGMISAHSHLWSAPFRGIAVDKNLLGWLAAAHAPFGPHYQEGDLAAFTRYGALDFLSHGITTCYNWVWNEGIPQARFLEQFEAQRGLEQRFVFGWALDPRLDEASNRSPGS